MLVLKALNKMMKRTLLTIVLIWPLLVVAGGSYHPITITSFEYDENEFSFIAKTSNEWAWLHEECKEIFVSGAYDAANWVGYKNLIDKDKHNQAIAYLESHAKDNEKVFFGYIGNGLFRTKNCTYLSKGLVFFGNDKARPFIMSIYDKI